MLSAACNGSEPTRVEWDSDTSQIVENGGGLTLIVTGAFAFKLPETEPWRPRTTTLSD